MPQVKHKEMKLLPFLIMATFATSLCFTTASAQQAELKANLTASEQQRKELSMTYGITETQAGFVQKFSHIRTLQIDSLSKLNLTAQEFRKERDKVTDKYYLQIYSILTAEQQKLFNAEAFKAARSGEVTSLNLPPMKAIEMGKIKADYINSIQELEKQQLSDREFKFRKSRLDKQYRSDIHNFLGDAKFSEWLNYKESENERRFKNVFGFTDGQYKKYIELENREAVLILKIKNSGISTNERAQKIADAKTEKVSALKELLSANVFAKWYEYYLRKENRTK